MFRLPPLKALRAFEAAARHESLSKAARELNVTHAAVSTQVKLLEESLGVRLFRRLSSGLAPTPQAMRYYKTVHQAFNQIHQATTDLLDSGAGDPLTVSCLPNMAMHWLLPRLYGFNLRHPDIKVNVLTAPRSLDFDQDTIDMAIWWGEGWPNQISRYLFSAEMVPVCSPGFLASTPLDSPADLVRVPRLHVQGTMEDWALWFEHAGVAAGAPAEAGTRFDSLAFALRAAAEGMGVAMGRLPLMEDDVRLGRLVFPFDIRYRPRKAWHLVYPPVIAKAPKIKAFEAWVLEEAAKSPYRLDRP
ncbi:transcriptional regulator GcvA [Pigmentiphaga sp.]|uniref:transcriptional regulator GcvA n=1 Tax=Pigmentiphaga sp. TaxID=1977564 RepID=UPI0025F449A5|nr:transcriptional regulator GcvA [Pigmentiphaga sp.]